MSDINEGVLSGRIAKKEMRQSGDLIIANISLAVNYYDRREKKEMPMYIPLSIFGKEAEMVEKYKDIGDQLVVRGEWRPQSWKSKGGENHYSLRLSVTNVVFGRTKGDRAGNVAVSINQSEQTPNVFNMEDTIEDDDLPF